MYTCNTSLVLETCPLTPRQKKNSTGLTVSANMSSEPLVSIEHATPTGQDPIRIWEGGRNQVEARPCPHHQQCFILKWTVFRKQDFIKEDGDSAAGEPGTYDLPTLFTWSLAASRAARYWNHLLLSPPHPLKIKPYVT